MTSGRLIKPKKRKKSFIYQESENSEQKMENLTIPDKNYEKNRNKLDEANQEELEKLSIEGLWRLLNNRLFVLMSISLDRKGKETCRKWGNA